MKIVFFLANSEDLDDMPFNAIFQVGLFCFPKYQLSDIQNEKVKQLQTCVGFKTWNVAIH